MYMAEGENELERQGEQSRPSPAPPQSPRLHHRIEPLLDGDTRGIAHDRNDTI
jgi:hypothetical protein